MEPPVDNIKLSRSAKEQLGRLKRKTGITQWNILCRWAFCLSLAEETIPGGQVPPADGPVEMTWRVFGGQYQEVYAALLKQRCVRDRLGTSKDVLAKQLRMHVHRGISLLHGDKSLACIGDLVATRS